MPRLFCAIVVFVLASLPGLKAQQHFENMVWLRDGRTLTEGIRIYVDPQEKLAVVMSSEGALALSSVDSLRVGDRFYRSMPEGAGPTPLYRLVERVHAGPLPLYTMHPAHGKNLVASARFVGTPGGTLAPLRPVVLRPLVRDDPQSAALVRRAGVNRASGTALTVVGAAAFVWGAGIVVRNALQDAEVYGGSNDNARPIVAAGTGVALTVTGLALRARHRKQLRRAVLVYDGR